MLADMIHRTTSVLASSRSLLARFMLVFAVLAGAAACGGGDGAEEVARATGPEALTALRAHVAAIKARPEKNAETIEVQHQLVAFAGTGTKATRSRDEAEQLAAELWARIGAGEGFDQLVTDFTDDSPPGIYSMTMGAPQPGVLPRKQMAAAFGDVGWRLDVGEFGVAEYAPGVSPFGWHIIKRTR